MLRLIAQGATNREVAAQLAVSLATAERHVANIYNKIGTRNRAEAVALRTSTAAPVLTRHHALHPVYIVTLTFLPTPKQNTRLPMTVRLYGRILCACVRIGEQNRVKLPKGLRACTRQFRKGAVNSGSNIAEVVRAIETGAFPILRGIAGFESAYIVRRQRHLCCDQYLCRSRGRRSEQSTDPRLVASESRPHVGWAARGHGGAGHAPGVTRTHAKPVAAMFVWPMWKPVAARRRCCWCTVLWQSSPPGAAIRLLSAHPGGLWP